MSDREILIRLEERLTEATTLLHKVDRFLEQNFDLGAAIQQDRQIKATALRQQQQLRNSAKKVLNP